MNIKKTIPFLVLSLSLIGFGFATDALASNHGNTSWGNEYRIWSPDDHTPARKKDNRTAYYNKTTSGTTYINIWAALYDGRDVSGGRTYRSYPGGQATFLYNLAVERYGSGVSVRIDSRRFANAHARGVWSPDSVR